MPPAERHTVRIESVAAGGAGVGRLADGRAVFVHRTAPGDRVRIEITERKPRWARARLVRVLEAGPGRRAAPCPYYARCGGCTIEHLTYDEQLRQKSSIVAEALRRIGGVEVTAPDVVASPNEFRYRNRLSFTLRRLGSGRVVAGFHELERPDRVLDIDRECLLPEPVLAKAWQALRAGWGQNANRLPAGETLRLTLRASLAGETSLLIAGGYGAGRPDELLREVPGLVSIWRARVDGPPERLAGNEHVSDVWHGRDVALAGGVFLQVNRAAAERLEAYVQSRADSAAGARVIDAYCGVGLYANALAQRGAHVIGLELDPLAVDEARRMAASIQPTPEFRIGRVEDLIVGALPADLVILNPPRTGVAGAVTDALLATPPRRLIYVSCDPATLARDLRRLAGAYRLAAIRSFDLFPQTAHVETVAELTCATS